jgi:hypothetical protein
MAKGKPLKMQGDTGNAHSPSTTRMKNSSATQNYLFLCGSQSIQIYGIIFESSECFFTSVEIAF